MSNITHKILTECIDQEYEIECSRIRLERAKEETAKAKRNQFFHKAAPIFLIIFVITSVVFLVLSVVAISIGANPIIVATCAGIGFGTSSAPLAAIKKFFPLPKSKENSPESK